MDGCPPLHLLRDEPLHLAACSECRDKLEALDLLEAPETDEERRVLDELTADPRRVLASVRLRAGPDALRIRQRPPWALASAIAAACAAAVVLAVVRVPRNPVAALGELQATSRPLELSLGDLPWAPYQPRRGAHDEAALDAPLRKLLEARESRRPGADRALATLYLLRGGPGDLARADETLSQAGAGAEEENLRGAVFFLRGDPGAALDHFLRAENEFNAALALEALGLRDRAARAFEQESRAGFRDEAKRRAAELRSPKPAPAAAPFDRREAYRALMAAETPAQLARAMRDPISMPDLAALGRKLDPIRLSEHARLYRIYVSLRDRALSSGGPVREVEDFARLQPVQLDPLLWAPSLQLAGYVHAARGDWREAQRYYASLAGACKVRGCAVENEAIALDELADLAGRDGDFAGAHRLSQRAEKLFASVGASLQLGELHRKRAALLDEESHPGEAAHAAAAALRELSAAGEPFAVAAAAELLAQIEGERGHLLAEKELAEGALDLAAGNRELEVDLAALLATSEVAQGQIAEARAGLAAAIARLDRAGHQSGDAPLRRRLAEVLLAQGDAKAALDESGRGLAVAPAGSRESERVLLHLAHAKALRKLQRDAEAGAELGQTLDEVARDASGAAEPSQLLARSRGLLAETAISARTADALALPLDKLRAAALRVAPAQAGWSQALPSGSCVLVLIPAENFMLQAVARREGGEVRRIDAPEGDALLAGTKGCEELWVFAGPPLDALALRAATGVATSLTRLLADEPREPPRSALFVSAQTSGDIASVATPLPGADAERAALSRLGARVEELSGERATPELALQLSERHPLLHFAVHGFEGGFLQLAGEGGRLAARDVAQARLQPGTRVVLSACESGTPGPGGVAWAFARAGAAAVAAARDKVDDAAAARWSQRFYAALGRGLPFARAAREAGAEDRAARFIVVK